MKNLDKEFDKEFPLIQPLGKHKCEGWNDDDRLEYDEQYLDFDPVKSFIRKREKELLDEVKHLIKSVSVGGMLSANGIVTVLEEIEKELSNE